MLLLFTIGPVQAFIAQARKTQDLYAGSFLLSHLCRMSARKAQNKYGAKVIFPDLDGASLPNRFVAQIEASESSDIQKIGEDLRKSAQEEFNKIALLVLQKLDLKPTMAFNRQINDYIQTNWVALSLKPDRYSNTYKELEKYMGAVKNVRNFKQLEEKGRKCSMTGEHNILFFRGKRKAYSEDAVELPKRIPQKYITDGEGLSAVSLVKRCAGEYLLNFVSASKYETNFPSTAKIALMESLSKISRDTVSRYKELFPSYFDEQLFYEENLSEKYLEKNKFPLTIKEQVMTQLRRLETEAQGKGVKLNKYYAIIMLDGDNMGKWLSGEFLSDKNQLQYFHDGLTRVLGEYAGMVGEIIIEPKGKLIYSGGDDVLALVNLNHLASVLSELRKRFPNFEQILPAKDGGTSTASVGVCIAHYKTPLKEVLNWARRMEKEAKNIDDEKDALAIAVLKHSGEIHKTVFKWQYEGIETLAVLEYIVGSLKNENFSKSFIKSLNMEFIRLMGNAGRYQEDVLVMAELKRFVERSCMMPVQTEENRADRYEKINTMLRYLQQLYLNSHLRNFLSFLNIAAFIEREVNVVDY
ncbi:MAG: type III-B CRISPR-associated protein Cas10/Cmr2 [Desulfotomaculaceae bacterium]|nr:type III-B CRISPR-associated protein Cas10/Cmr2 [Desulfotomaculaceae bacterium]